MRRTLAIALLLLPAACKQVDELPPATPHDAASAPGPATPAEKPPAWLSSEASVFEHVQQTFEQAGFPAVRTAVFRVTEDVPLPSYQGADRTLSIPPFADGPAAMRARLARASARHFGGALAFIESFDSLESAYTGYRAFLTVAVAHELAHHLQLLRRPDSPPPPESILAIETEAIEFEQAFLAHEIETKRVPPSFRDHYRRAVMAIRDTVPEIVYTTMPTDEKALSTAFARAYLGYSRAPSGPHPGAAAANSDTAAHEDDLNPDLHDAALVYATYTQKRLTLLAKPGRTLEALAKAEADPPPISPPPRTGTR